MDAPSPSTRKLARQLLALEVEGHSGAHATGEEAIRVCDKLQTSLTRFAGPDGFTSLLRRAMTLAGAEVPELKSVKLEHDGCRTSFVAAVLASASGGSEAAVAIIASLLELLVTFIGEPLTLRLVRESWPNASLEQ